jgi:hypothetical protein
MSQAEDRVALQEDWGKVRRHRADVWVEAERNGVN